MHLVVALEEEYDVKLKTREIMQMRTIASAREVLKAKGVEF
jgi:acyl carrier protein